MKNNLDLILNGPVLKMICKLSLPNSITGISMVLIVISDAYFVSKLGNVSLASLALVFPFITLMQMMSAGAIGGASTSSISRFLGANLIDSANSAIWHAVLIGISMSIIYSVIFVLFPKYIFMSMGADNDVLEGAIDFSQIAFGGAVFTWLLYILSAVLRAIGEFVIPAIVQISGCFLQIVLAGALTLGWFGFPNFGIMGPAIAMIVSHFIMVFYLYFYIKFKQNIVKLCPYPLNKKSFFDIMKVGIGGLINSTTIAGTVGVVTATVSYYGVDALAGYGLGSRLEIIITPLVFGIGSVLTATVGINAGANQINRARNIAWVGAIISFLLVGIISGIVSFYPELWLDNFQTNFLSKQSAILYLIIVGPFYCFFAAGQTLYFASQGTGKIFYPVLVGVIRFLSVSIICYFAIKFSWSINSIFYAVSFGLGITGIGLGLCMLGRDWKSEINQKRTLNT